MSIAFTIRATLLMTLMPDADARQVMATLLGDLLGVPWRREHAVPSGTVLSRWRTAIGPAPLQQLKRQWLAAVGADHDDGPAGIDVGGGLQVGAIDGTVTRMPDTKANRRQYGTAGSAGTGFPQIRSLHAADAFTRTGRAVVTGPAGGDKAEAEQKLLDRMLTEYAWVFTKNQLWIMDRYDDVVITVPMPSTRLCRRSGWDRCGWRLRGQGARHNCGCWTGQSWSRKASSSSGGVYRSEVVSCGATRDRACSFRAIERFKGRG